VLIYLFNKLSKLNLPGSLKSEFCSYLSMIQNNFIRGRLEDQIVDSFNARTIDDSYETIRVTCLNPIFRYMGLRSSNSNARHYSKKFCEYTFRAYSFNNYEKFCDRDRSVLYKFELFDEDILDYLLKFNHSPYFDETVLSSVLHPKTFGKFLQQIGLFVKMYPDLPRAVIIEYILYYKNPLKIFGRDKRSLIMSASKLTEQGIDFFAFSDEMHSRGCKLDNHELDLYVYNLGRLKSKYGLDWRELFPESIPSYTELKELIIALSNGAVVDILLYRDDSELFYEYMLWLRNGFPFSVYLNQGYRMVDQLRLIRYILQANCDPSDFKLDPSMTAKQIHKIMEARQGSLGAKINRDFSPMSSNRMAYTRDGCK